MKTKLSSNSGIPLGRAAQVHPFIDFLDAIGAPTQVGLERNKLPPGLRECPEMLASTRAMFAFVDDMARREGIDDIGWRAPRLTQLSPRLLQRLNRSPTLLLALLELCRRSLRESSHAEVWLEERGDALFCCHRGTIETGGIGSKEAHLMQSTVLLSLVRFFTGPDWVPPEIGIALEGPIGPYVREALGDARIRQTPDHGWLLLPRSIPGRPPQVVASVERRAGAEEPREPAHDLVGSLSQFLRPYLCQEPPAVQLAAHMAGTSVRSLQRELALAGSSYRAVLQRAKFDAARELLKEPDVKITDVAFETGFQHPPHFSRFFRQLAGVTPREYRATLSED